MPATYSNVTFLAPMSFAILKMLYEWMPEDVKEKKGGVLMVRICAVADVSVGERKYLSFLCLFVCKENDEWLELSLRNYEKGLL